MKKRLLTLAAAFCYSLIVFAQAPPKKDCGTMKHHEYLKQTRPNYEADLIQYNQMLDQYQIDKAAGLNVSKTNNSAAIITIPVVVHVIYRVAGENISDAQAISQVTVLNNDFAKLNADASKVTQPTFSTVASGAQIRFCLAQRDPSGNPTTGVTHKTTTVTAFSTNDAVKSNATGGQTAWDVTKYVNIWVCNMGPSLLGYGEFPTASLSNTWGLVLHYKYTGSGGSAVAPYNLGRTGTHEFGHCFNLLHIWGDEPNCTGSDQCSDTPNQGAEHYGPFPQGSIQTDACSPASPGTMWMNYMDYTDDNSMYMFTAQQVARMEAVVNNAPWNILGSSLGCTPVSALDAGITSVIAPINGSSSCNTSVTPRITLSNTGSTTITTAKILYKMDALATQTLNWSGSLASGTSTILTLNAYTGLTNASHTFSSTVTAPNGGTDANSANNTLTSTFTIIAAPAGAALPFIERFDAITFPPTGWVETNVNVADAAYSWTRVANTTGIPVVPTTTACAKMDNFAGGIDISGQLDALRSPAISFTGANSSLNITFDVSHRIYSTVDIDTLNVYISTDCGGSWTKLYTKGGAQLATAVGTQTTAFTPTANAQWRRETVSLSAYAGLSSVYMKFESRSGWGNNLYLDNVNVSYTTAASPPVASFSSTATKCIGSPITFTDLSTNSPTSWAWSFPGGTASTSTVQIPSITYTASGTYTVTLTSANASGTSTPVSQTITVNSLPTLTVSGTQTINCASPTVTLTGSATPSTCTPVWTGGVASGANSYTATATAANIYTLTITNPATGCVNTKTTQVVANAGTPSVITSVTNSLSCATLTAQVIATTTTTPVSYSWTGPGVIAGATTASATVNASGIYTVIVTNTVSACSSTLTTSVIQNTVAPSVTGATSGTLTCTTLTVNANATTTTTPVSYNWTGTGITAGATTGTVTINQAGTFNYTVTNTSNGCNTTGTRTVTQNTVTPSVVGTTSGTLTCTTLTVNANVSTTTTPVSYNWLGTGITSGAATATITVNQPGTFNYTVTGSANGCKTTGSLVVTQNTLTPSVTGTPSGTLTCTTLTVNANATTTTTPVSYNWSGTGITAGAGTSTITVNQPGTFNYTVTSTTNGCKATGSRVVTQNINVPSVTSSTSGSLDCVTPSANAMVSSTASPVSYNWSGTGITSGAATATITVNQAGTFNYTVTDNSNGCSSTGSQAITQNTVLPTVSVSSATICSGSTGTITASGSATTYSWNTGTTGANLMDNPAVNTIYTVMATGSNGCVNTATASISVGSAPSISVNSATICSGSTATLTASGVTTYTWSTTSNASSISVNPTGTTVYTVSGNLTGCVSSGVNTATVTVNLLPNVTLGAVPSPLCVNNSAVTLSGSPSGGVYSGPGVSGSSFDPAVSGAGTFTITYDYTDVNLCSASATQTVNVSLCTGITDLTNSTISVYPNPAKDAITVSMDASLINHTTIELYDAIGKLVITEKVVNTNTSIIINSLSTGIYTVRVISDGKQIMKRIIKE